MKAKGSLVPVERIVHTILLIRGHKVILDADLAKLYGVSTKRLNEQVRRNLERFPADFMFRLNKVEKMEVVANCDHLINLKFSHSLPLAFTEHGALMLASVLNSPKAVETSIFIVRAFVRIREMLSAHKNLEHKLGELERAIQEHDAKIQTLLHAFRQLAESPPEQKKPAIGFQVGEPKGHFTSPSGLYLSWRSQDRYVHVRRKE